MISSGNLFTALAFVTTFLGYLGSREKLRHRRKRRKGIRVTVIGDIACDIIADNVQEIPKWGEELFIEGTGMSIQGGGSGLNTAAWLHHLSSNLHVTVPQTFSSRKGDIFTDTVMKTIDRAGLYLVGPHQLMHAYQSNDLSDRISCEVERDRLSWSTGVSFCLGSGDRRSFVTFRGGNGTFELADFEFEYLVPSKTQHVHIAGFYNCPGLWDFGEMEGFIKACRRTRGVKTISLNPQFSRTWGCDIKKLIPLVDFFICNQNEAIGISGQTDLLDAVMTLANTFECNCVVVTLGGEGALLMRRCIDLRPVRVLCKDSLDHGIVDTVGVGDAFCAGILHEIITKNLTPESPDLLEAVRFGCACGTAACTVSGGSNFPGHHTVRECLID